MSDRRTFRIRYSYFAYWDIAFTVSIVLRIAKDRINESLLQRPKHGPYTNISIATENSTLCRHRGSLKWLNLPMSRFCESFVVWNENVRKLGPLGKKPKASAGTRQCVKSTPDVGTLLLAYVVRTGNVPALTTKSCWQYHLRAHVLWI